MDLAKNQENHLKALKCLGESFFELERFRRASDKLKECKKIIDEKHPATESKDILEIKIDVLHLLGRSQYELGNFDTSEDYLNEALEVLEVLEKNSKKLDCQNLSAKINMDLSQTLLEFNDFDLALKKAASAIGSLNGEPAKLAKIVKGKIRMSMEDFSGAINDFMDDVSLQAKHNNVRVISNIETRKEIRKQLPRLVSQNKMLEATLISYLGYCHLSIGEMVDAEYWGTEGFIQYEKISKSEEDPTIIEIHFMRGQTLTKTGNFRKAQITLEKGLQIAKDMFRTTPNHPLIAQSYLHLGLLLIEPSSIKDLNDAKRYLTKAKVMSVDVYSECDRKFFTITCKKTNEKLLTAFSLRSTIVEV
jgi:tetratricopeptide (TPR) repeat protein